MRYLKVFLALFVLLVVAGGIAAAVYLRSWLQPVNPAATERVRFVIPKGQSISRIGQRLADQGLVRHPLVFRLLVEQQQVADQIQAGSFLLSASMTPAQLISEMTKGTDDIWITLLEGWRREEMAASLTTQELENFDQDEFLALTADQEGYLFPDTYLVQRSISTAELVQLLTNTFTRKVRTGLADELAASGRSLEEVVVMASLIQREARDPQQMLVVSGILWNRIEIGMALNVDATLQYIKGYDSQQQSWWVPPLAIDKERPSPYNTYQVAGLPPGPIANPGLAAIQAAIQPAETEYLYYLHDPQGNIHYGRTLPEHNANVQQYLR